MLRDDADRHISLRRTLGYKLVKAERHLRAFAHFAAGRGEAHIRSTSVLAWLATVARTSGARERRLTDLILFARFLHAEDPRHDIPRADFARSRQTRPIPYIYRAGPGCLDSAPLDLSGFLPGYAERGALRFCRCVGRA
ncbi:hypothetical protein ACVIQT_000019 [Bradyrhizobium diazoefficiens]